MSSHDFPSEDAHAAVEAVREWSERPANASRVSIVLDGMEHDFGYWLMLSFHPKDEGKEPFSIADTLKSALNKGEINGVGAPVSRATSSPRTATLLEEHVSKYLTGTGRAGCKLYYSETATEPIAQPLWEWSGVEIRMIFAQILLVREAVVSQFATVQCYTCVPTKKDRTLH